MKSYCLATGAMVDSCLEMFVTREEASVGEKPMNLGGGVRMRRGIWGIGQGDAIFERLHPVGCNGLMQAVGLLRVFLCDYFISVD